MVRPWQPWVLAGLLGTACVATADVPDGPCDPVPKGAITRLGSACLRPAGLSVAFTSDSRFLATSHQGWVSVFDLRDGSVVRQWRSNHLSADGVAFTPDSKHLVAGAGATAFPYQDQAPGLWDWRAARLLRRFQVPARAGGEELGELTLSPDGLLLALRHLVRQDHRVVASSFSLRTLRDDRIRHTWPGTAFVFAPDRARAAVGAERQIRIVDLRTGQTVRTLAQVSGAVSKLGFLPDGKTLAALAPNLGFWDVATGARREGFLLADRYPTHVDFCVAWRRPWVATRAAGGTVHVWDVTTRKCVARFDAPGSLVAFSPDDQTLVVRQEMLLHLWDTGTWRERCRHDGHSTWVGQAVYSPDGRRVATSAGPRVLLWDTATGKLLLEKDFSESYPGNVRRIQWSPDGRTIASADRHLHFWDAGTGKELGTLSGQLAQHAYCFHPRQGSLLIFFPGEKSIQGVDLVHYDLRAGKELGRKHLGNAQPVALSPSGSLLVLEDGYRSYRLWDSLKLRPVKLPNTWWAFAGLDDRHVAFSDGSALGLWDRRTGTELWQSNRAYKDGPGRYQFSPEGRYLYVSGWSAPQALRVADGRVVRTYRLQEMHWVSDCQMSPDGRVLVCLVSRSKDMVDQQFVSIETATGIVRGRFAVPADVPPWSVRLAAVAPDSTTFLSVGPGLSAVVWDLAGLQGARRQGPPRPKELAALWQDLAGADADKAQHAVARLVVGGRLARDFLAGKLRPARPIEAGRAPKLIGQLVDDDPAFRAKARAALRALDRQARPALQQALKTAPAGQLRELLEQVLDETDGLLGPGPLLRQVRAVEVLEHLGATDVLGELARGDPMHRLTQESQAALKRRQR